MARTAKPTKQRHINLPLSTAERLERHSERTGVDQTAIMSLAIYEYLQRNAADTVVLATTEDSIDDAR